jgi:HEAT repeats
MNTHWRQIPSNIGIALVASGLLLSLSTQHSVHARQVDPSAQAAPSITTSDALKVENGKLELRQISGSLSDTINRWAANTRQPEWLGYSIDQVNAKGFVCCEHESWEGPDTCGECRLENHKYANNVITRTPGKPSIRLETRRSLAVLFRAEAGKINEIRVLSVEYPADAGGLALSWLGHPNPTESVNFLTKFVLSTNLDSADSGKLANGALMAIALHAEPAADRALEAFVAANQPLALRKDTVFWLGEARGAEGLRILRKMAQSETSPEVREQIAFALSISKEPGALPELIRMAHDDESPRVRGQALFWLGQKAGQKAAQAISGAIDDDPDTEIKKKAIFALSQMPPEQGVPKMIAVAQANRNPQLRKEAMFWLSQSDDPRALAFLENILTQ